MLIEQKKEKVIFSLRTYFRISNFQSYSYQIYRTLIIAWFLLNNTTGMELLHF